MQNLVKGGRKGVTYLHLLILGHPPYLENGQS